MTVSIRHSFRHLDIKTFNQLFKSMVCPHVEFAAPVWNPSHKRNIRKLESVQIRTTKEVSELKNMSYKDRGLTLQLPTLAYRHMRGDTIEVYKLLTGKYDSQVSDLLSLHRHHLSSNTRGHPMKLLRLPCSKNLSKHFFNRRVTNMWNALPVDVINAFKNRLDKVWDQLDIKYRFDVAMAKEKPFCATGGDGNEFHQYRRS